MDSGTSRPPLSCWSSLDHGDEAVLAPFMNYPWVTDCPPRARVAFFPNGRHAPGQANPPVGLVKSFRPGKSSSIARLAFRPIVCYTVRLAVDDRVGITLPLPGLAPHPAVRDGTSLRNAERRLATDGQFRRRHPDRHHHEIRECRTRRFHLIAVHSHEEMNRPCASLR